MVKIGQKIVNVVFDCPLNSIKQKLTSFSVFAVCGWTTTLPPIFTFNLTGGLRSSSGSFLILLLLSGRLNLLESVLLELAVVWFGDSLSNLTSHFLAAV